ncbi:hypothetical protein [Priestia aryabhattai]|uniref:hypothetical protein n=1 Tax=Priestia aryabhattai TaxID=412384 RepID=UPI0015F5606B|nr:hypothetical protein [Priestia aryabhattai]
MLKYISPLFLFVILIGSACSNESETKEINNETKVASTETPPSFYDEYEEVLQTTWKDASYDMENNLQKPFYIKGTANLSTYYNYKFTNEQKLFCVELIPEDGNYTDRWYFYFDRDEYKDVYNDLLNKKDKTIEVIAYIPKNSYSQGQGNMAVGMTVRH